MQLKNYLAARMTVVTMACLAVFAVVALAQAVRNIRAEGQGALQLQLLIVSLNDLQVVAESDLPRAFDRIEALARSNELRHMQFELRDADGRKLVESQPAYSGQLSRRIGEWLASLNPRVPKESDGINWSLARSDGKRWSASLRPNLVSEQEEAAEDLLGLLAMMAALTLALTAGAILTMRRALRPIGEILNVLGRLGRQDYAVHVPASPITEMQAVGQAVGQLARSLAELETSRRSLSVKLLSLQEEERVHLARELHDELGQKLTVIRMNAGYLSKAALLDAESRDAVYDIADATASIQQEVRDLLGRLRPQGLGQLNVEEFSRLMHRMVEGWRAVPGTRLSFELNLQLGDQPIPESVLLAIYRITQEALTNVARHARASQITLTIDRQSEMLLWRVRDDGRGIDRLATALEKGNGLAGMRERIWSIGGTFEIETGTGGTALIARMPCAAMAAAPEPAL